MSYQRNLQDLVAGKPVMLPDPECSDKENRKLASLLFTRQDQIDNPYVPKEEDDD